MSEQPREMNGAAQQPGPGISRRGLIKGGLLAGLGAAALTAASSAIVPGVARASTFATVETDTGDQMGITAQDSWRYCGQCRNLYYSAHPNLCIAAAGGFGPHTPASATVYDIPIVGDSSPGNIRYGNDSWMQSPWHWCWQCGSLVWAAGVCVGGYPHDASLSGPYWMLNGTWRSVDPPLQAGWRYCNLCAALYWGGAWSSSQCTYEWNKTSAGGVNNGGNPSLKGHAPGSTVYYLFMS